MSLFAIGLLLAAAVLHTTWNLLLKRAGEKYIATWWSAIIGFLVFTPSIYFLGFPSQTVWHILLISALLEISYYIVLGGAYQDSDFSLIYPMGRGAAPALIAVWAAIFLHERFTAGGLIGIIIIISGLLIVGGSSIFLTHTKPHTRGILLALLLALLISIYSILDGVAVRQTAALPYVVVLFLCVPAFTSPLIFKLYGWRKLKDEFHAHGWTLAAIGVLTIGAYSLALWAYSISPLGYAGAIREVSVVMAAYAGWQFLGEKFGPLRILGAVIIFAGIMVIGLLG
ncbi:MAG TPA: DMT family transporter [Anaerolineales bacterium]|nr:DMT family transporter [Anaerolineales bacterium]